MLSAAETEGFEHLARWAQSGKSFVLTDPEALEKSVLPKYFGLARIRSFARQLSYWGFTRVWKKKTQKKAWEYEHPSFLRGMPSLLPKVLRSKQKGCTVRRNGVTINLRAVATGIDAAVLEAMHAAPPKKDSVSSKVKENDTSHMEHSFSCHPRRVSFLNIDFGEEDKSAPPGFNEESVVFHGGNEFDSLANDTFIPTEQNTSQWGIDTPHTMDQTWSSNPDTRFTPITPDQTYGDVSFVSVEDSFFQQNSKNGAITPHIFDNTRGRTISPVVPTPKRPPPFGTDFFCEDGTKPDGYLPSLVPRNFKFNWASPDGTIDAFSKECLEDMVASNEDNFFHSQVEDVFGV